MEIGLTGRPELRRIDNRVGLGVPALINYHQEGITSRPAVRVLISGGFWRKRYGE